MPGHLGALWLSVGGVAVGAWAGTTGTGPGWRLGAIAAMGAGLVCLLRRSPVVVLGAAVVAAGALGYVGASVRAAEGVQLEEAVVRTHLCDYAVRVLEQSGGLGTLVALEAATCSAGPLPPGNVFWDSEEAPVVGTVIHGRGWLRSLGDDGFARARRNAGGRALLVPISEDRALPPQGFWGAIAALRDSFARVAAYHLPEREAALLLGLTIGETSGFSDRDLASFRTAGLTHVLAVSGSNVAIVLGAVAAVTGRVAHKARLTVMLGAAVAFVALVGPDGSVLRAAVMGSLAVLAGGWVRPVDPVYSLPFALLVLIAARPTMVMSAGLHLSAAATLGIVLWSRVAAERMHALPRPLAASLAVTLAAQVGVAPLLVVLFERLSIVAPVSNVLAAFGVVVATLVGMSSALLAPVLPEVAGMVAGLARPALWSILEVADASAASPWAEISIARTWGWILGVVVITAAVRTLRRGLSA